MTIKVRHLREMGRENTYQADSLWFWCPGCNEMHRVRVAADGAANEPPIWEWDGVIEPLTISPSILTWSTKDRTCHSFIKNGQWQFLSDCTHALAGQTVDMVDLPEWFLEQTEDVIET